MFLYVLVLGAFLPSVPGCARNAHPMIKTSPGRGASFFHISSAAHGLIQYLSVSRTLTDSRHRPSTPTAGHTTHRAQRQISSGMPMRARTHRSHMKTSPITTVR